MLLVASLFSIKNRNTRDFFVHSVRRGGSWQATACRIAPELIELDVFEHMEETPKAIYLCLDLWTSTEAYHRACCSPDVQDLLLARRLLADSSFELGAFAFATAEDCGVSSIQPLSSSELLGYGSFDGCRAPQASRPVKYGE